MKGALRRKRTSKVLDGKKSIRLCDTVRSILRPGIVPMSAVRSSRVFLLKNRCEVAVNDEIEASRSSA